MTNNERFVEIWLFLNRSLRGPLGLWEVPKPSVPPVAEAASAYGSKTVSVRVALIVTAINEQYTNFFTNDQRFAHLIVYFVRVKEMECVLAVSFGRNLVVSEP